MIEILKSPFWQLGYASAICVVLLLLVSSSKPNAEMVINFAALVFVGFMIVNSIGSYFADSFWIYVLKSVGAVIGFMLAAQILIAIFTEIFSIKGSQEGVMIFLVVIYYPVGIIIMGVIRSIFK